MANHIPGVGVGTECRRLRNLSVSRCRGCATALPCLSHVKLGRAVKSRYCRSLYHLSPAPPPSRSPFSPIPQRERERGGRHTEEPIPVRETSVDSEDTSRRSQRGVDLPDRACSVASEQEEEDKEKQALLEKKLEAAKEDLQKQKAGEGGKDDESGSEHLITHIPSEIQPAQRASFDGLFCPLWGKSGCKKWLSSPWAFKQHLCSKHDIPRDQAARVADGQWKICPAAPRPRKSPTVATGTTGSQQSHRGLPPM